MGAEEAKKLLRKLVREWSHGSWITLDAAMREAKRALRQRHRREARKG